MLCDDVHDSSYPYAWAGQTLASFQRATAEFAEQIEESTIWSFPQLPDWYGQEPVARPFGLVRKKGDQERGTLPRGETAFVLSELEGIAADDELVRHLRLVHGHPGVLEELAREPALLTLVKEHPAALTLLAQRAPLMGDLEAFQQGAAPSTRGTFSLLLFLLRRALARRLRPRS